MAPDLLLPRPAVRYRALRYLAYPAMTTAAVGFGLWAVAEGWPSWQVGVVAVAAATALVALLEWLIPYSQAWTRPHGDRLTDLGHLFFSNRAFDIGSLISIGLCAPAGRWLSSWVGAPLWPHGWPLLLQTLLAIAVFELPWYWLHRLGHSTDLCWRVHSVHHSSRRIYWWNFSRNHPLDNLVSALAAVAPLALLGAGDAPLAVMAAFSAAHGMMQHSNIDLRTGFLDFFLSTARVHRWHHSPHRHESDANYSPRLMLWDHVFGTYRFSPDLAPPEDVGLGPGNEGFPESYVGQLKIPFQRDFWRRAP
jgi:ornithine lipid hydroxylase